MNFAPGVGSFVARGAVILRSDGFYFLLLNATVKVQAGLGEIFQAQDWNGISADAESTLAVTLWRDKKNNVQLERMQRTVSVRQQLDRITVPPEN